MDRRDLGVASPCTVDWGKMTPNDRGRFCGDCKKVVHDLSRMTEREARALFAGAAERMCVRYVYDRHGRVFFAPPPSSGLVPAALLNRAKVAARAAVLAAPLALAGCLDHNEDTTIMGDIGIPFDAAALAPDADPLFERDASPERNPDAAPSHLVPGDAATDGATAEDGGASDAGAADAAPDAPHT